MTDNFDLNNPECSCYWWDRDGGQYEELRFVSFHDCLRAAKRLIQGPAKILSIVHRVIITDGGDNTIFEWKIGAGVTWPKQPEQSHPPQEDTK